jgi:hypothetical protein
MLKTISLADAAVHVIHNDYAPWQEALDGMAKWGNATSRELFGDDVVQFLSDEDLFTKQVIVTVILVVMGFVFWFLLRRGFNRNVLMVAVPLVVLYMLLNAVILGAGLWTLLDNPDALSSWTERLQRGEWEAPHALDNGFGWLSLAFLALVFFPQLALGLSGFEMSLILMPQVKADGPDRLTRHRARIRNTRRVLVVAAR